MPTFTFNPQTDVHALIDKVILITGGTAGLGASSVLEFARHSPAHIFFSGRNQTSADALIKRVQKESPSVPVTFLRCDISSFASIRTAADAFKSSFTTSQPRLDILMLNAGVMATSPSTSTDGYESQFATNYLGHALLTNLLTPTLLETASLPGADVRVISMSSYAHGLAPTEGINFDTLRTSQASLGGLIPGHSWARYGQAKLSQVLFARELAARHPQITSVAVHPGFIWTGLWDDVKLIDKLPAMLVAIGKTVPVEQGHYMQVWAATTKKGELKNGGYYEPVGRLVSPTVKGGSTADGGKKLGQRLWEWTEAQFE